MTQLKTLNVNEATQKLRDFGLSISAEMLTEGLLQGVFPFGVVVKAKRRQTFIFERLLDAWIAERVVETQ